MMKGHRTLWVREGDCLQAIRTRNSSETSEYRHHQSRPRRDFLMDKNESHQQPFHSIKAGHEHGLLDVTDGIVDNS